MKTCLLGIDIGTSACKAALFDENGCVIASVSEGYPVYYPHEGWAEQDPEDWWMAVQKAIKRLLDSSGVDASSIAGIGIDGQSWSAIPIDEEGQVLCPTPIWMDTRAREICDEMNERIGRQAILSLSGNSLQPSYTTGKILWYKRNHPAIYKKIDYILQSNSFIAYRLTGVLSHDLSQGYGLHCFNMEKCCFDDNMAHALGFSTSILPELYACHTVIGYVSREAAKLCHLKEGTPVVAGGLDAACGTLGAGVIHEGETQEQGGQAGGMSICTSSAKGDERLILGCHLVPGLYLLQGGTTGGGGVMRWLEQEFGAYERQLAANEGNSSLDIFNQLAEKIPAGSDGLVFLPYMAGERSPIWDPDAKGVFFGLDFKKTKGHLIRSAMEGCAYALKHNLDTAKETGVDTDVLRAMGGSANSLLWTQIKADITEKRILVPSSDTATTLGAAILAGVGTGVYTDFEEAVSKTVKIKREHMPNHMADEIYQKNYKTYLALYQQLKDLMKETAKG